ncbi:MAG TPA: sugar phosphate nucleotidyltransferase [Deltaproteobacteria bacterium]|nr:sugar phosphate nucleotidyltransferase [Deltaproteobacteria bacterium]HPR56235.1 sugar phosphate nucleotidyltransferase [Deltaproteobacteria bacterium]HXK46188.1 sugar phosphate nucleotidyltransferase [Deltaproteobacteria bacterium]
MALQVVIMAGGKGERLWPVSSGQTPKQLIPFEGEKSLLRCAFERSLNMTPPENIYVVTSADLCLKVQEELPEMPKENVLAEPVGRNTAPCIGYAAALIAKKDPKAMMAVFPSDHLIREPEKLKEAILFGAGALESHPDLLITLGVVPDRPETGYGYIAPEVVLLSQGGLILKRVRAFHEKPARILAEQYLKSGYLWNAGMFLWRVDTILDMFSRHMPELHGELMSLKESLGRDTGCVERYYRASPSISIDYGIMEKADRVAVIPVDFGWSDVGSWDAMGNLFATDAQGNTVRGSAELINADNNVIWSMDKRIVLIGVNDLVVVEGPDSILVCPRSLSQQVSSVAKKFGKGDG